MPAQHHESIDLTVPTKTLVAEELRSRAAGGEAASLLMALVQITGDTSYLDRFGPSIEFHMAADPRLLPVGDMPARERAELIELLVEALASQDQAPYVQVPSDNDFLTMLRLITGSDVEEDFVGVIREQGGFVPSTPGRPVEQPRPEGFHVAILGAGMTGLGAAIAMADAGFSYEIFEAADDIGGTWRINTYPGVAVDTPSIYYSFSFELESQWSKVFPLGSEYQNYLRRVVDKFDVKRHIHFNTTITSLTWDEPAKEWIIATERDGVSSTSRANAVITAAGFLNRPKYPDVPGIETFAGQSIHSAAWGEGIDVRGKRVGVIGAGATSVQIVDSIYDKVEHLTLFQRQAHWVMPNHLGEGLVSDDERWLQEHVPFYDRWQRTKTYFFVSDGNYPAVRVDPEWMAKNPVSISAANDQLMQMCLGHLDASFGDDADLKGKLTPNFPPHGKRIIRDPGAYYTALAGDNSDVFTTDLAEVTPTGITLVDGTHVELDVIIYATGFTLDFLSTVEVIGRDGALLSDQWANNDPRSYLGGTVPNFPNLFVTSGPNSSNGHGGGHNFMTEVVVHYITQCLLMLTASGAQSIEVTQRAQDEFLERVDAQMEGSIWRNNRGAHTYYKNESGRAILPNPWRMVDYWGMLRTPDPSKFVLG